MQFDFVHDVIKSISGLDFEEIENSEEEILKHLSRNGNEKLFESFRYAPSKFLSIYSLKPECIYTFTSFIGTSYMLFICKENNKIYSVGPALLEPFSKSKTALRLRSINVPDEVQKKLLNFCATLPVTNESTLNKLILVLYGRITGLSEPTFQAVNFFDNESIYFENVTAQTDSATMRSIEKRYEISAAMTEAVKLGNYSMAVNIISKYNFTKDFDPRSKDPLRNFQNYCIIMNTQMRHALEECHIHPYQLDMVSHDIGMQIERMTSIGDAEKIITKIIKNYCRLVQENAYPNLKRLIHLTVTYIKDHLADSITIKETARALSVNANYLSTVFHRETGMTFIDFVNEERLKQAAHFLKYTNMQIQQIAYSVGYNNTSYFSKLFRERYGCAPREFKDAPDLDGLLTNSAPF